MSDRPTPSEIFEMTTDPDCKPIPVPTPITDKFYESFADGEATPNQEEWLNLCRDLETKLHQQKLIAEYNRKALLMEWAHPGWFAEAMENVIERFDANVTEEQRAEAVAWLKSLEEEDA